MSKQILLLAGVALLFAGAVQAKAPGAQAAHERLTFAEAEAPAPTANGGTAWVAENAPANAAGQEQHADPKPKYFNTSDCGGD